MSVLTPLGFTLLRELADGDFHSGEDLAAKVGLTRARVSQVLKEAEASGLALERVKGRGYRLLEAPGFLDADTIRRRLVEFGAARPVAAPLAIEIVDQIESTSTELSRRSQRRDIHGMLLAAEWQTAGRGRRGRSWTAVAGGSLTFSLGWRFEQGAGFLAGLSLAVGVAVVRALEAEGFTGIALKWPNDLIHRHHKLGGILIDLNGDALGPSTVVIGVGINVRLPASVRDELPVPVTDLTSIAARKLLPVDRNRLLARLVDELAAVLHQYATEGFAPFAAEWQHRHAYQGKMVKLLLPDGATVTGKVAGVDASGALVLADGPRRARFLSGEISLRRA
ncbi:MAG: biotin--[acetyl-CoA-carboxylase] ligase [Betaproteobacteria bacterium]|mgnify:CR=1 FL=1|nr:biotin--[acetyl-CoA-carboxylase] ligase [Betaproteobacteria bacterium]MBK7079529.1 biotin--[acetyl-CoA-carboxylase] ligase [Betaproteobacteria bacterium]MBK7592526.1 biotin--[acetyl-CoA-carboxylase] ligase [Betaproteobacteria bacterium]MBK7743058.1 biotin--[acetyl-CoA-carboxylase] ligase [Betaproteobacteria bacterium]MBK8688238.1 biotin--[acetyl-CoA-carboxylase] ligase [Betaproteobacteria bacterium]